MITISFFKCGFCYAYTNVLAVGSFIACVGGFIYNILLQYFQPDSFDLAEKVLSVCSCTFIRLDMVDFDVKIFYYDS